MTGACHRLRVFSPNAHILSHLLTMASRWMTGPSTVGWAGSSCLARVMRVEDGMIMGRISEMNGNKDAMADVVGGLFWRWSLLAVNRKD